MRFGIITCLAILAVSVSNKINAAETKVPVTFSDGHEIAKNDFGRPIPLMAAALGVKPEVFREAFSGVTPAKGRGPTGDEARKNKGALLKVLGPYGVTNERMDEVANYYRFRPQDKEIWPTTPAKAEAIVENGKIKKIVVIEPGSSYCPQPNVKVEGFPDAKFNVELALGKDLKKNGGVKSVELVDK